jgi:hypothetical protein
VNAASASTKNGVGTLISSKASDSSGMAGLKVLFDMPNHHCRHIDKSTVFILTKRDMIKSLRSCKFPPQFCIIIIIVVVFRVIAAGQFPAYDGGIAGNWSALQLDSH